MGAGLTTEFGLAPPEVFGFRVSHAGSTRLGKALEALLSGDAVDSVDGKLEISYQPVAGGDDAWRLRVRVPSATYRSTITVRPLDPDEIKKLGRRDRRNPTPAPSQWVKGPSGRGPIQSYRWELFNCEVVEVTLENNT